jgi:PAS domain S-box-containing protein
MKILDDIRDRIKQSLGHERLLVQYRLRLFAVMALVSLGIIAVLGIQNSRDRGWSDPGTLTIWLGFLAVLIVLFLLLKGRHLAAGHLYLGITEAVIWYQLFFIEFETPFTRLDSLSLIFIVLVFTPFIAGKRGIIIHYSINFAAFVGFYFHAMHINMLPDVELYDFFQDNGLTLIFICLFSYLLYEITEKAQEHLLDANLQLKDSNLEIAATNEELRATMEELEATMEELEASNEELIDSQSRLEKNERRLTMILENLPQPLLYMRKNSVRYVNTPFLKLTGRTSEEMRESGSFLSLLLDDATLLSNLEIEFNRSLRGATPGTIITLPSFRTTSSRGELREVELQATVLDEGFIILLNDITEVQQSRQFMVNTEKLMTIGGLAAGVAHEINNPLGIITQGITATMKRIDPEKNANISVAETIGIDLDLVNAYCKERGILNYLEGIQNSARRASEIITGMLQFSRMSDDTREEIDIHALLEESISMASRDFDLKKKYDFRMIDVLRDYRAGDSHVQCTPTEIEQVFLNLLKNSAQALSETAELRQPVIQIHTSTEEQNVIIRVEDNGPGIPPESMDQIFEPFFTTKKSEEGTGLGLYVSRHIIVNKHRGDIRIEQRDGEGVRFIITLPKNPD